MLLRVQTPIHENFAYFKLALIQAYALDLPFVFISEPDLIIH